MAYLRFTLWISLLFYDIIFLLSDGIQGQQITLQTLEDFQSPKELHLVESFRRTSSDKFIVKRNAADDQPSNHNHPQIFKFELDDAKEPDEETKKLIQLRARELQLKEQNVEVEVLNMTHVKKRSKRAAQKVKPQLIPFLITDAKEPDNATKELIRRSRAKELSLAANKESTIRQNRHKDENSEVSIQRQNRGKNFASIAANKEPLRQGRARSVTLTTENKEPLRQGKVQSVPLTATENESLRVNRATSTKTQQKHRSSRKTPRKRTRRFAQLTEPRYIKFELHDVKEPSSGNENRAPAEVQILPRPVFGAKISNQMPEPNASSQYSDTDLSMQGSKYRYFIQQAPRRPHYGPYPKRYEHNNDVVFRVSKMQKYIASGQGLENINTNIEITIPPEVSATAILGGYPKHVYGQKICPYGNQGCQVGPLPVPAQVPVAPNPPPEPHHQEEFNKPVQKLVSENEILPEVHPHQYYYNIYPQPQPEVQQQFIPIATVRPYQAVAQIVETPIVEQQPLLHQEPLQVHQQHQINDNKLIDTNSLVKVAYLEPTYGYGNKLYPYTIAKNIPLQPANDQDAVVPFDSGKHQGEPQNKNYNDQANQLNLLKNNQEFQELSALIGKSPMDQVHGLSYLLAKEMQRQKSGNIQQLRPQDQTSPILFHPKENSGITNSQSMASVVVQKQNFQDPKVDNNQIMPFRPLRQLNKYIPPPVPVQVPVQHVQHDLKQQANSQNSQVSINDDKGFGLSPNYNGIDSHNYSTQKIYPQTNSDEPMEYASKYSFGYRVRDLHSGNDFAHKQNRDEDGVTRGQYHILMPDGRMQNVIYYADETGYHADIV